MSDPADFGAGTAAGPATDDPEQVVRSFLAAMEDLDVDRALLHVAPGIVYHNKGLPPARGIGAFERQMRGLARYATGFEARMHNIATAGPVVLTERTDVIEIQRFSCDFWVCGTFEVRDGRIVLWRDHFDYVNVTLAILKGLVRLAVR